MNKTVVRILLAGLVVGLAVAIFMITSLRSEKAAVQSRLNDFCRPAQAGIQQTARAIRSNSPDKAAAIHRVFGEQEITGSLALSICPSKKFNVDAWVACKDRNDEGCMLKMLDETATSIEF